MRAKTRNNLLFLVIGGALLFAFLSGALPGFGSASHAQSPNGFVDDEPVKQDTNKNVGCAWLAFFIAARIFLGITSSLFDFTQIVSSQKKSNVGAKPEANKLIKGNLDEVCVIIRCASWR